MGVCVKISMELPLIQLMNLLLLQNKQTGEGREHTHAAITIHFTCVTMQCHLGNKQHVYTRNGVTVDEFPEFAEKYFTSTFN